MEINANRIVTLSKGGADWRNLLDTLVGDSGATCLADTSLLEPVSPKVFLLMDSTTPRYKTANRYDTGVANLLDTLGNIANDVAGSIPILGDSLKKIGATVTDVASLALDMGTALLNPKLNGVSRAWNPWWINAPTWEGVVTTLSFQYIFKFSMGQFGLWNAKEEVFKPCLNLMAPTMIQDIGDWTMVGPYPRTIDVLGSVAKDAFLGIFKSLALKDENDNDLAEAFNGTEWSNLTESLCSVSFGSILKLDYVLLKNSDVVFSSEVDENGYPISATVTLDFSTVVPQSLNSSNNMVSMRFGSVDTGKNKTKKLSDLLS